MDNTQQIATLSEAAVAELLDNKKKLTEFSTTALVHAITVGLMKVRAPGASPNAVNQFIEALRKVRADLTGDDHERQNVPQMMVNIQFNNEAVQAAPREVQVQDVKKAPAKQPAKVERDLDAEVEELAAVFEQATKKPGPPPSADPNDDWFAVKSETLDLFGSNTDDGPDQFHTDPDTAGLHAVGQVREGVGGTDRGREECGLRTRTDSLGDGAEPE